MSLNKAIESGKEHRYNWQYHFAKRVDKTCRNHGGCIWCEENRTYKDRRDRQKEESELMEYEKNVYCKPSRKKRSKQNDNTSTQR